MSSLLDRPGVLYQDGERRYVVEHKTDYTKYVELWASSPAQARQRVIAWYPETKASDYKAKRA